MKSIPNKSKYIRVIEERYQTSIEELLRRMFVDENKTIDEMLDELGVSYVTLLKWLDKAGIYSRKLSI